MPTEQTLNNQSTNTKDINKNKNQQFSWQEIEKQNTDSCSWLVINEKVYDITKFAKSHPGGDMIRLGAGKDASILFYSYHPQGVNPQTLQKLQIGTVIPDPQYKSWYSNMETDEFYNVLKSRVMDWFKQKNMTWKGESNKEMYIKTFLILLGYFTSLYCMIVYGSYLAAAFFGICSAEIGVSIMHDGSHGSFSKIKFFNWATSWMMDMIGSSSYVWEVQHVSGHHIHTNNDHNDNKLIEVDPDVFTSYPFIRMHPDSPRKWFHKYQHIYSLFLFALFTFSKVLYSDFSNFYYGAIMHLSMVPRLHSKGSWFRVFFMKFITLSITLGLNFYFNGFWQGFKLYLTFHIFVGLILALMFQVTHLSEGCTFIRDNNEAKITDIQQYYIEKAQKKYGIKQVKKHDPRSWAVSQCHTAANWATTSWFWSHFSGGLNHQIEHHLFPFMCHVHYYGDIQKIVEKTCAEYGVAYINHPTFGSAIKGLLNYLKQLGNPPTQKKQQ